MSCPKPILSTLLAALALLAACSSPPDPTLKALRETEAPPGAARLVIYYPPKIMGADGLIEVSYDGGDGTCLLASGTYTIKDLLPGKHDIKLSFCGVHGTSFLEIHAAAGEKYFARIKPYDSSLTGIFSGYPSETVPRGTEPHKGPFAIERMDTEAAYSDLESMRYVPQTLVRQ